MSYFEKLEKKYDQPRLLSFEAENTNFSLIDAVSIVNCKKL